MDFFNDIDSYKQSIAIITEQSESISYEELTNKADALRIHLKNRRLVFCFCDNNVESVVGYLGCLRAKAPVLLLSSKLHFSFVENLLTTYKPDYIWALKNSNLPFANYNVIYEFDNYELLQSELSSDYKIHDELALLLTTSGSTGSPKLVRQSYKNIISNAASIAQYLSIKSEDRAITSLPLHYTYGLSILNSHLLQGSSLILTNKTLMDKTFWELIKNHNATTFGGVPYIYEMLKKLRFSRMELPSLKVLTQAGGRLSLDLLEEFTVQSAEKGIRFVHMYGQTEATARMSYLPSEFAISKLGSIGIPIPGGQFWLEDDNGTTITEPHSIGELVYKGENVTMGYAEGHEDLNKGDENHGVLKTGDIAKFDEDGYFYIVGRKKRFLKLFGNRINLDEIEQFLKATGYDCACTGEDDKMKVFVTNAEHSNTLYSFISEKTGLHRSGFSIISVDSIPRNEAGKVLYSKLGQ